MSAVSAEVLKLRSTRTFLWVVVSLAAIVVLAAVVHFLGFYTSLLDDAAEQRAILTEIGVMMGLVFAAIAGSLSITTEVRHGTIRPTLLKQPDRWRLLRAKLVTQLPIGAGLAVFATALALALAAPLLHTRGLSPALDAAADTRLVIGAAVGGAGFAVLGVAIGALVRNQVPVVVGLLVWMLFIENLLRAAVPSLGRFAPGSLGRAIAADGTGHLGSPLLASSLLVALTAVTLGAARLAFERRDIV